MATLSARRESWPLRTAFSISRGTRTASELVVAEIRDGDCLGRGECLPYAHYGETGESVLALVESTAADIEAGMDRQALQTRLPAGAARNALDCAFWDLEAKRTGQRIWTVAGLPPPAAVTTVYTLSLDAPDAMRSAAAEHASKPILKLKLGGAQDLQRVAAVRAGAPNAKIVVDANEGWTQASFEQLTPALLELGVTMIEQPFPSGADAILADLDRPIPVCADESCHDRSSLAAMTGKYDMVNIKLDKTGGLTEALALSQEARAAGLQIMVGCMIATSLSMAPGVLIAQGAEVVDLDGPLLLANDREHGLHYDNGRLDPPSAELWG